MLDKLIEDIDKYIEHLKNMGFYITIHGNMRKGMLGLLKYNLHDNPYCAMVKSDDEAWKRCICMQNKIFDRTDRAPFFGMCHAGVEEYVFYVNDDIFISVSGFGINRDAAMKRINRISDDFILDKKKLINTYDLCLIHEEYDIEKLKVIINPLCHMLTLLKLIQPDDDEAEGDDLYNTVRRYVMRNFMQNISVSDIAKACSCSTSAVSHIFKKYSGMGVHSYITQLRIAQACRILENTNISVGAVAQMCGFSDSNYFSYLFKKKTGCSPSKYYDLVRNNKRG